MKGSVVDDESGRGVANASVVVDGINHNITSTNNGDFWRLLTPATYKITFLAAG